MERIKRVRVLQQDASDEIRIGRPVEVVSIDILCAKVIKAYESKGLQGRNFAYMCETCFKKVSIVDAVTLSEVKVIYERKIMRKKESGKRL